jgi:hypothetical protein
MAFELTAAADCRANSRVTINLLKPRRTLQCALLRLDMGGEHGPHLQPGEVQAKAHVRSGAECHVTPLHFSAGS